MGSAAIGVASAKKRYWFAKLRSKSSSQSTTTEPGLQVEGFSRTCESETIYWPADLLPSAVPRAKIWAYGYNADVIGGLFQANNKNNILRHGNDFMMKVERALKEDDVCARAMFGSVQSDADAGPCHLRRTQPRRLGG